VTKSFDIRVGIPPLLGWAFTLQLVHILPRGPTTNLLFTLMPLVLATGETFLFIQLLKGAAIPIASKYSLFIQPMKNTHNARYIIMYCLHSIIVD